MGRMETPDLVNPCLSCGACCAYFRILLAWTETDEENPDGVPAAMTVPVSDFMRVMRGTERTPIRCAALTGEIGKSVRCSIYERRGTMCREFSPLSDDGTANEACDQARAAYGLPPLHRTHP